MAAKLLSEHINGISIPGAELSQHMMQKLRDSVDINNYETNQYLAQKTSRDDT